ncbi:MAG: alanyl-tRNA synthetase, partial [Verrucomicrobiaceae bacterium]|nr:alanyl-tRNA synthetase [Verrucomicrobiaceae bacterium]
MMTAAQIRQSFLDFFKSKQHTIVPSDNVGYTSRDGARIFTNAGMNQFVPIFLGERSADVDTWPGVLHKGLPTRAADTQKCIRAGGKHNDLEDVGLDTYHHTLFEMLGNWSFGDYFKKEAISWAWELIIEKWKFPATRVFATIYQPGPNDPAERDQEAWDLWAEKFRSIGLDPDIHIVNGNKKDNFWQMGDTGPCGPCTEIHIDLTPGAPNLDEDRQRAGALLVNGSDASCIEIWNNVFIQYNANPDGTFVPLPAQHVDTGMGFERVCSIIQGTKNFTDFENAKISNYDTDVFKPIFDELTKMSGKHYQSTLPKANAQGHVVPVTEQEKIDVAFRVIADHLRTLSFAIADGIQPGNSDRNYTLRRILRRAVKYGRTLEFKEPFFYKLVDVLADNMGDVFPELRVKKEQIKSVLKLEEESFNRTLDRGIELFNSYGSLAQSPTIAYSSDGERAVVDVISGNFAFQLYDTYGFPLDLTELMARERGLTVDVDHFNQLMEEQKVRAREAGKKNKQVVSVSEIETKAPTKFIGYDTLEADVKVLEVVSVKDKTAVVLDASTCYAEMGGQIG